MCGGGLFYFFVWLAFCFDFFFFGESKREKEHDVGLVGIYGRSGRVGEEKEYGQIYCMDTYILYEKL